MTRRRALALAAAVALASTAAGYGAWRWWFQASETGPALDMQALFAARLANLSGGSDTLEKWRGQVLVVNFWATWCPPCLKEIPEFIRMQEALRDRRVQFVGIAIDDPRKVADFAAKIGINYPVLMAETDGISLARAAGNRLGGLPFTVVIDRQGKTARIELGVLDEGKLLPILQALW